MIVAFAPVDWSEIVPGLTPRDVVLFLLSTIIQVRREGGRCEGGRIGGRGEGGREVGGREGRREG